VLCLLAVASAVIAVLAIDWGRRGWGKQSQPILSESLQLLTLVGFPLVAMVLGILQIVPEKPMDAWAFLVHRPIARWKIFAAKSVAGLLMYAVVSGVPLLGAAVYVTMPGNVAAPFEWRMMLPRVADLLSGVAYYFVGQLIVMRQARWVGGRLLPLGAAVIVSVFVVMLPEFYWAMIPVIVAATILAMASGGSFVAGGQYTPQPRATKAALYVSLAIGTMWLIVLPLMFVTETIRRTSFESQDVRETRLWITREGQIVEEEIGGHKRVFKDLDGHPLDAQQQARLSSDKTGTYLAALAHRSLSLNQGNRNWGHSSYRDEQRYFTNLGLEFGDYPQAGRQQHQIWYFLKSTRTMKGFDVDNRRWVASGGADGFAAAPVAVKPFDRVPQMELWAASSDAVNLVFPKQILRIDFAGKKIWPLVTAPADETILDAQAGGYEQHQSVGYIAVATDKSIYFYDPEGERLASSRLHYPAADILQLSFGQFEDGRFVLWYNNYFGDQTSHVVVLSKAGEVIARSDLPAAKYPFTQRTRWEEAIPAVFFPIGMGITAEVLRLIFSPERGALFASPSVFELVVMGICIVGALAAAGVTVMVARRNAFSRGRLIGWTIANFLLGLGGWVVMMFLLDLPRRAVCSSCGKKRVLSRDRCEHCGAEFAGPAADGTEIFDDLVVAAR
jgi:hypothetical protein